MIFSKVLGLDCAILILGLIGAQGCNQTTTPALSATPPPPRDASSSLERLVAENSLQHLTGLLRDKQVAIPQIETMQGNNAWTGVVIDDPMEAGMVNRAASITCREETFVVAPVTFKSADGPGLPPKTSGAVYVFDRSQNLVGQLGTSDSAEEGNDEILIANLGSKKDWFVLVTHYQSGSTYEERTGIYRIARPLALLVTVFHRAQDLSLPILQGAAYVLPGTQVILREKPNLIIMGKDKVLRPLELGIDQDGNPAIPQLKWIEDAEVFEGASELTYRGEPVFEVNLKESPGFRVQSTRQWSETIQSSMKPASKPSTPRQ